MGISGTCVTYNTVVETSRWSLAVLILISNTLTITTLLKTKQGIGQKGKWYIISLSLADMLMSLTLGIDSTLHYFDIFCPAEISEEAVWKKRVVYIVLGLLYVQSLGSSLLALVSIAIDRIIAVSKPIFYKHHVNPFRIKCLLVIEWMYIFVVTATLFGYFGWMTDAAQVMAAYNAVQIMPSWCYKYIFTLHIYLLILANLTFYPFTLWYIRKLDSSRNSDRNNFERTKRYLKMSGVTLATMLTLWFPYLVVNFYAEKQKHKVPMWLNEYGIHLTYSLVYCNCWVNPVLYCWLNKDYRNAFKKVLGVARNKVEAKDNPQTS